MQKKKKQKPSSLGQVSYEEMFSMLLAFENDGRMQVSVSEMEERAIMTEEDYLLKGERIQSLAKAAFDCFLDNSMRKEETDIYKVNYENCKDFRSLISKMATSVFRPLLAKMDVSAPEDENLKKIMAYFEGCSVQFSIEDGSEMQESWYGKIPDGVEKLKIRFCDRKTKYSGEFYGLKGVAHKSGRDVAILISGIMLCDPALFLSSLFVIEKILPEAMKTAEADEDCLLPWKSEKEVYVYEPGMSSGAKLFFNQFLAYLQKLDMFKLASKPSPEVGKMKTHFVADYIGTLFPILYKELKEELSYMSFVSKEYYHGEPLAWMIPFKDARTSRKWHTMTRILDVVTRKYLLPYLGVRMRYVQEMDEYRKGTGEHARSCDSKKHVTAKVLRAMQESLFNNYFSHVEYDCDCDVENAVKAVEKEWEELYNTHFPFLDLSGNTLRIRKLGHHKAAGLYYPRKKCMCVDLNCPSAFLHELGHLIDYCNGNLSAYYQSAFSPLYRAYEMYLRKAAEEDSCVKAQLGGKTKYNMAYYLKPTEVFARCFELYCYHVKGIRSSLLEETYEGFAYPQRKEFLSIVKDYFDGIFLTLAETDSVA